MEIRDYINLYKSESNNVFLNLSTDEINDFVNLVFTAYEDENRIFACGNGGNVASVENLVVDLNMHPFVSDDKSKQDETRNKFHAVSLCNSPAILTGISNDLGSEHIFSEQLKYQARKNDVLFCMSGSGNSKNIIVALKYAKSIGMKSVVVTRNHPCKSEEYADLMIYVKGVSKFPGQVGKNNNNFHYEDCISKLTHIAVGLLKLKVQNENIS